MLDRQTGYFFSFPFLNSFIKACHYIEQDPNYQPEISDKDLLNLVFDEQGRARHRPSKSALAIQESTIKPLSEQGFSLGKVYQIKIAHKTYLSKDDEYKSLHLDQSVVLLVNYKGNYSLHARTEAEQGNFKAPLPSLKVSDFLNQECLHYPNEQLDKSIQNEFKNFTPN